jgi:hypothetical protein
MRCLVLQKFVKTKWNSKTKKYYESLGYTYTKMGNDLVVKISHLKNSSNERIKIKCDFCGKIYNIRWADYNSYSGKKDACLDCNILKVQEGYMEKYGVRSPLSLESTRNKLKKTNLERYGEECVFKTKKIKNKIKKTNLEKFGTENPFASEEIKEKIRETCLSKYGVEFYSQSEEFQSKNKIKYDGKRKSERFERGHDEYIEWRTSIFVNDHFTCKKCGKTHCNLEAHHVYNFKDYPDKRYDKDNGATLCVSCHKNFHKKYGKKLNTKSQLLEFIKEDK